MYNGSENAPMRRSATAKFMMSQLPLFLSEDAFANTTMVNKFPVNYSDGFYNEYFWPDVIHLKFSVLVVSL